MFFTHIALEPAKVEKIVLACCALHNFLRVKAGTTYVNPVADHEDPETHEVIPGAWRNDPHISSSYSSNRSQSHTQSQSTTRLRVCLCQLGSWSCALAIEQRMNALDEMTPVMSNFLEACYYGNLIDLLLHMPTWAWHIYWFVILSKCFSFSI